MKKLSSLSIFFPAYNDEKSIIELVEKAYILAPKIADNYEIYVINDGSIDKTAHVLQDLKNKHASFQIVNHKNNMGYGGALQSGFRHASMDYVFYTDGDGQYDPKELELLVLLMTDEADFVNGIKITRHDPTYRVIIGNLYSYMARWLFWLPIYDIDCDFRLIRRSLLCKLSLQCNSGSICVELVKCAQQAGARFRQVSVHHYERRFGGSQFFRYDRIAITFFEIMLLWMRIILFPFIKRLWK